MPRNTTGLSEHLKNKTIMTLEKVDNAIRELVFSEQQVNFNSVSRLSGVSKTFLYKNNEVKIRIEELREKQTNKEKNQRAKFDKTAKSKDIIIQAKDKKIAEIKMEVKKLKAQIETLRGKLYEKM